MLFVAWELMSIPTYILVGYMKKNPSSNEAALKYFLFGALSSAIIVYGISISYGLTGSTNIGEVIQGYSTLDPSLLPLALLSVGMFIAGFGFKMGLVPAPHQQLLLYWLLQQRKQDLQQQSEL
jgi:NADH-quinone oxidoreductase subunit N